MRVIAAMLASVVALPIVTSEASRAQDAEEFCHWYARTAMSQTRAAMAIGRCNHFVEENALRWNLGYQGHFEWCMNLLPNREPAFSEHHARAEGLYQCISE
jgi:hypothetical protein